ncbi:MAG TPA: energy transducer TonB [Pyrinomonadaceae bacterium]|nr:energy transducer TonB [Pyrinomonadaceae bacterium]
MKHVFRLIVVISAFASAGALAASSVYAQSGRTRRAEPPKEERAQKPESKDEAKDEAKDKARDDGSEAQKDVDGEKVWTGKEVSVRAVIKSRPLPGYPREARPFGVAGQVKLRIILGADGEVRDEIEVLEGLPYGVTEEAIKAARQIEFEPAQKDGRPVSQYVTLIYNFNLH